jgi:hypothetical protein
LALGIIDALLVRTADDSIGQDNGLGAMFLDEGEDLVTDVWVGASIAVFDEPASQGCGLGAF